MADISSSIIKSLFSSQGNKRTAFNAEEIDERILRLLGLEDIFDLDYDTYISLLKEQLVITSMGKRKIPREEEILLQEEYKKVKSKKGKGRFNPKKKITANAFRKGSAVGINLKVKSLKPGIGKGQLALPPALPSLSVIEEIKNALNDIIQQLTSLNDLFNDELEKNRITRENLRRRQREEDLEKRFDGVKKATEKVIAPVKSILQKIIDFFLAILIGRSLILLLRWFSDEKNKDKINAIGRFLGDHWPKLLALFIAFGTGLGGFVRGLIKLIIGGTSALMKGALALAARAGIKGAGGALKFLGGPKGRLIGTAVEVGATALGTLALSKGIENFGGIGGGKETTPPVAKLSGGGFANFGNLFGNMGSFFNGMVSGPKGVDKVPAMLTDGEFVMSRGAVEKYGVDTLESMNAMGGGNNKPKVVGGTTYASGGGLIGSYHKDEDKYVKDPILEKREIDQKKLFGPGSTPQMSSQEDMNKLANQIRIDERLRRIENQIQVNLALSKGKGINIKGATSGAQLGTGHSSKYQGRNSIVIKGGAKNFSTGIGDKEITLGGKRYYAQKRGDDVIYSVVKSGGSLVGGSGLRGIDKKKLPPTQIMMGGDNKPFVGFLAFEKGEPVYKRGADPGTGTTNPLEALGRWLNPNSYKQNDKKLGERKKRESEVNSLEYYKGIGMRDSSIKQQMTTTGQNYTRSSNDLQYRQNTQAKIAKSKPKTQGITPPSKPKVNVSYVPSGGGMGGRRGSGGSPSTSTPKVPQFSASSGRRRLTPYAYGFG